MKKTLLTVALAIVGMTAFAQKGTGFGIKGGISYNQSGNLTYSSLAEAGKDVVQGADGKTGFNIGVFGQWDLPIIYLRPELVYTNAKSSYNIEGVSKDYTVSSLDLPVLVGINLGPISIFTGPAFQYIMSNDLEDFQITDVENDFTVGLNVGVGLNLGRLGLDVRWARGLSENEATIITDITNISNAQIDSRPNQFVFSASIKL